MREYIINHRNLSAIIVNCIIAALAITVFPHNITDFVKISMFTALIALFDC